MTLLSSLRRTSRDFFKSLIADSRAPGPRVTGVALTVVTLVSIAATFWLSAHPAFCSSERLQVLHPICRKFDLLSLDEFSALIWAQNVFTIMVGWAFYVVLEEDSWRFRLGSVVTLFGFFLLSSLYGEDSETSLLIAAFLSSWFFALDWHVAHRSAKHNQSSDLKVNEEHWTRADRLLRGCLYSSGPAAVALWAVFFYEATHSFTDPQEKLPLVAGVAAFALVASNVAFSVLYIVPVPARTNAHPLGDTQGRLYVEFVPLIIGASLFCFLP